MLDWKINNSVDLLADVYSKLGNGTRLLILSEVAKKEVKLSEVLEKTDMTVQALHKQLMILVDSGLVRRHDGKISLTGFGRSVVPQIPTLVFLTKHREYFQHHSLAHLPTRYRQSIGSLKVCHEIHNISSVLEKTHSIIRDSKSLKIIVAQFSLEILQHLADRLDRGNIDLQYIMGENTIVPKTRKDFLKKIGWEKWLGDGIIQRKMIESVDLMMILSDEESLISFPNNNGLVNLDYAFYSKDKAFHEWCEHLFEDIWNVSHRFNEKKFNVGKNVK